MQKTKKLGLGMILSSVATLASAHAGHDHGHWMSDPIHVLSVIAIAGVAFVGYRVVASRKKDSIDE